MGTCASCDQYKSGVCPIGNPYKTMENCIFKSETKSGGKMTDYLQYSKRANAICEDWKNGLTLKELSKKYGKADSTIRRILEKAKVRIPVRQVPFDDELEKNILSDLRNGAIAKDLSKKYGVTLYRINTIKKEHGLISSRKTFDEKKEVVKTENVKEEIKEEVVKNESLPVITFLYTTDTTKPFANCYPSEFENKLCWAIDIHSMDEFMKLVDEVKSVGSLVIDGALIDVVPVRLSERGRQEVEE